MKTVLTILLSIILSNFCYAQVDYSADWANSGHEYNTEDDVLIDVTKKVIHKKDLSYLLKSRYPNYSLKKEIIPLYGLLGNDFNKIEFVFADIEKSDKNVSQYHIKGKTYLKGKINDFKGYITFEKAIARVPKNTEESTKIVLIGSYELTEDRTKKNSGTYLGKVKMILSTKNVDTDDVLFNMGLQYEEGAVRGFVGIRKNHENDISQSCIWGFTRFPHKYAQYFDIGDGEEVINIKYAKPWFNFSEQKWNNIINGHDKDFYLHSTNKDKGIHTSHKAYIKPEEATWHKLNPTDLENSIIEQLKLNPNQIETRIHKELPNNLNETVMVMAETENDVSEEDYSLTSHILIVNSITGKIKNYFSENSKSNGWVSNAIFIDNIAIDTLSYKLNSSKNAFGVIVKFRSSSQPNPYSEERISLFTKENDSLKKILDFYMIHEDSGIVNVNMNTCYSDFKITTNRLSISNTNTNGYYDIVVNKTITQRNFRDDENGECNPKEKIIATEEIVLKFNGKEYK
ncbi:PA3715 family protein [Aquimarina rubra]|uniref:Uncharacterized protein n=1 Tax=Aquimarina rubra TaxID=1920033 RepID=A0ABW5LFE6_9FLAO